LGLCAIYDSFLPFSIQLFRVSLQSATRMGRDFKPKIAIA
jgi:hypothetical protein